MLKEAFQRKQIQTNGKNKNLFWLGAVQLGSVTGSGPWIYRIESKKDLALIAFFFLGAKDWAKRIAPENSLFPFICRGKYYTIQI